MRNKALSSAASVALAISLGLGFGAGDAGAWSLEEAAKPYAGTEVRGICSGYSDCQAYLVVVPEFEEITGIKITIDVADLQAIQMQILADAVTEGEYFDFVEVISFATGVFPEKGFVIALSRFLDDPKLRDPEFKMENIVPAFYEMMVTYKGVEYGMPNKYLPPYMVLRKDLVNDEEMANFKAKYGYDMPLPPDTWQQYYDLAEFYTRKKGETVAGKVLERDFYGTLVPFKRHLAVLYDYERVLLGMGGRYVNDDGTVAIDQGDAAVKALEFYLSLRDFSPPGYTEMTWDHEYSEMCAGNIFTMFTWGDTTPYFEIPEDCPATADNLAYFQHPGTGLTVAEGQPWMIMKTAKNPEGAWLFLQWLLSEEVQVRVQELGAETPRSDIMRMERWQAKDWPNRGRERIHIWYEDNDKLYVRPNLPHWLAWIEIITEELSAAGADMQDAETTIANIARRMREAAGEQ